MFSLVAIQTLVECKLKWFLFPGKFFLSTQALRYSPAALSCSTAVHFQTWCMALPQTQTRPGQDFYNFPPAICVEKVKSAPLENLGEIRVAGEEWRYPQQFCLNTNWTLLRAEHFTAHRLRDSRGEVEGHHNHHDGFEVRCIELMRLIMTRVIWRNCNCHVALDHIIIQL